MDSWENILPILSNPEYRVQDKYHTGEFPHSTNLSVGQSRTIVAPFPKVEVSWFARCVNYF